VDELPRDPRPRHLLQVRARLAELDGVALDLADAEALADQVVEPQAARRQLPPCRARQEADVLHGLLLDERQRPPRLGAVREVVAISLEPLAGNGPDGLDA